MKISKRDIKLLLCTGGILILIVVFFQVFTPAREKNEILKQENQEREEQLAQLESLDAKKDFYQEQTTLMQEEIEQTLSIFSEDVREEDVGMYANMLETKLDIGISGIAIGAGNQLFPLQEAVDDSGEEGISLFDRQITYTFTVSYEDLKKAVAIIQEDGQKKNVENVILSFDPSTGKIVGNMLVNMYYVHGIEAESVSPEVAPMPLGTDNPFGTAASSGEASDESEKEESQVRE